MAHHPLPPVAPVGDRRDGRPIFPILGASPDDPSNEQDPTDQPPAVTQEALSKLLAREKSQGGRAALKKLAGDLGFADTEALSAYISERRAADDAALTEVQRREQAADQALAAAKTREQAAEAALCSARLRAALAGQGATGDDLADAERLISLPDDADDQAVSDAVAVLKERRKELFGQPAAAPPAPGGAPAGGPPPRGAGAATPGSVGLAMAKRRGYVTE
ncbi:hypothetical protein GCM10010193_57470 [Kitasatospora atroaurantiaca]|uniref:Minor structural protein GP20 n=1 Tax=Kitasatospora atroaurantiaca TaxID=285545 RepID=A0A561EMZ3_9ACTN|nr:hypothetical protein [Kitasatospora atroaurantiaca]TWE16993.1 hypothetical protein FB465_1989 [Kitasatospora atroaurantiaca]